MAVLADLGSSSSKRKKCLGKGQLGLVEVEGDGGLGNGEGEAGLGSEISRLPGISRCAQKGWIILALGNSDSRPGDIDSGWAAPSPG